MKNAKLLLLMLLTSCSHQVNVCPPPLKMPAEVKELFRPHVNDDEVHNVYERYILDLELQQRRLKNCYSD